MHIWPLWRADVGNLARKKLSPSFLFSVGLVFCQFSSGVRSEAKGKEACPGWQAAFGWLSHNMHPLSLNAEPAPRHRHLPPARYTQRGQSRQKALLPFYPGLGHKTRDKQACKFIPESFCFCDTLLSQPDRMRNKYHQNITGEAILEVFIAQPRWRMFGCLPRQPIFTVFPSQFLNCWALTQTESGLFEVCLSLFTMAFCEGESREGSWGQGCEERASRAGKLWWALLVLHVRAVPPCLLNTRLWSAWVNGQPGCI